MRYSDIVQWSVEEVGLWLCKRGFDNLCDVFVELNIDGDQMLQLTEKSLTDLVKNGIMRKRLWRDLRLFKRSLDYSKSSAEITANILTEISEDLVEYSHNMITAGLIVDTIDIVDDIEYRLKEAGVDNITHFYKIKEMLERQQIQKLKQNPINMNNSIYITSDIHSRTFASLVQLYLQLRGVNSITNDFTRFRINMENIIDSDNFVAVLQSSSDDKIDEVLMEEIKLAQELKKNIILVVDEKFEQDIIDTIDHVEDITMIRWIHDYQKAAMDRIEKFIRTSAVLDKNQNIGCYSKLQSVSIDSGIDVC